MYEDFLAERLAALRTAKGVSAREMSLTIGQSENYINSIENKKTLPSMTAFFYICEYFGISPKEFFDDSIRYPRELNETVEELSQLNEPQLASLRNLIRSFRSECSER